MAKMRTRLRGTGPRATVGREALRPYRSARAYPSHAPQPPLHIKVLTDLFSLFPLMSIDMKVFQTFSPHSLAAPHPANPAHPGHPASDKKKARREK